MTRSLTVTRHPVSSRVVILECHEKDHRGDVVRRAYRLEVDGVILATDSGAVNLAGTLHEARAFLAWVAEVGFDVTRLKAGELAVLRDSRVWGQSVDEAARVWPYARIAARGAA